MAELTEDEKRKHGDGMGGYASKRDLNYQVRWREELEKKQAQERLERLITSK